MSNLQKMFIFIFQPLFSVNKSHFSAAFFVDWTMCSSYVVSVLVPQGLTGVSILNGSSCRLSSKPAGPTRPSRSSKARTHRDLMQRLKCSQVNLKFNQNVHKQLRRSAVASASKLLINKLFKFWSVRRSVVFPLICLYSNLLQLWLVHTSSWV